jgi:hypothetical protein
MLEPKIINRGRGPEIAGTRITVYELQPGGVYPQNTAGSCSSFPPLRRGNDFTDAPRRLLRQPRGEPSRR